MLQQNVLGGSLGPVGISDIGVYIANWGLVLSTDIARYTPSSSGELTQGAGATAVLVEHDPRLLEIDLTTVGQYSDDADDFFRPLGVNGSAPPADRFYLKEIRSDGYRLYAIQ